ncbi:MAG: aminotransferase class V-fold PLP-dependent enzyme [Deltaproteobacteria bacterium]|nr:aminotransferase class V-fold PLP-dependent enzyme [Deltaproteobacteria bacterium]MBW2154074.1 aminotransferase class V-fold PLP-dependent enzyme [Deltaproteobacteria bacterium]
MANISTETDSVPMEAIFEKIDKDTCLLCFQHASNQTGAVNDAKTIIQKAREINPDLYVLLVRFSMHPMYRLTLKTFGADAYAVGPYKAYCIKGIRFAHISERLAQLHQENIIGKPSTNWVLGSPPHAMYAAWSAVIDYMCWLGSHFTESRDRRKLVVAAKKAINHHILALLNRLLHGSDAVEGLLDMEHVTVCGMEDEITNRMCIFLFRLNGFDSPTVREQYNRKYHVRVSVRVKDAYSTFPLDAIGWPDAVRLSAAHYNTSEEVDRFLKVTKEMRPK